MSYYTPPSSGGGGGGFPKVVAVANYTAQSGNLSFDLLSGALPTGDYLLADTLSVITPDSSTTMTYTFGFNSDAGMITIEPPLYQPSQGITAIGNFNVDGPSLIAPVLPSTIHAVTGTPISVAITVTPSAVATATPTSGNAGLAYAVGDTGTITTGDGTATYGVTAIGAGGAVTSVTVAGGSGYTVSTGNATATGGAQPGVGTGLELDILTLSTDLVYSYHATLTRLQ